MTKNRGKSVFKNICFFAIDFLTFFFDFLRFWLDFGRPWALQKFAKNRKNRIRDAFGMRFGFFKDFGSDFGAVLAEFGWILNGFLGRFLKLFGRIWVTFNEVPDIICTS